MNMAVNNSNMSKIRMNFANSHFKMSKVCETQYQTNIDEEDMENTEEWTSVKYQATMFCKKSELIDGKLKVELNLPNNV